jgi:hypothetical protein
MEPPLELHRSQPDSRFFKPASSHFSPFQEHHNLQSLESWAQAAALFQELQLHLFSVFEMVSMDYVWHRFLKSVDLNE